jgi:hypothetical protein
MNAFIQSGLRHNRAAADRLQTLPAPVRELYELLLDASSLPVYDHRFEEKISRLSQEFHDYAGFFPSELKILGRELEKANEKKHRWDLTTAAPVPSWPQRLFGKKFCRSFCKRLAEAYCWLHP